MSNSDKLLEQIKSICKENKSSYKEWLDDAMVHGKRTIFFCIKIKGGKKKHVYEDSFSVHPIDNETTFEVYENDIEKCRQLFLDKLTHKLMNGFIFS